MVLAYFVHSKRYGFVGSRINSGLIRDFFHMCLIHYFPSNESLGNDWDGFWGKVIENFKLILKMAQTEGRRRRRTGVKRRCRNSPIYVLTSVCQVEIEDCHPGITMGMKLLREFYQRGSRILAYIVNCGRNVSVLRGKIPSFRHLCSLMGVHRPPLESFISGQTQRATNV